MYIRIHPCFAISSLLSFDQGISKKIYIEKQKKKYLTVLVYLTSNLKYIVRESYFPCKANSSALTTLPTTNT